MDFAAIFFHAADRAPDHGDADRAAAAAAADAVGAAAGAVDALRIHWRIRWYVLPYYVLRRSAYWRIAGMPGASPWQPLIELFRLGCVPIGFVKDEFVVYCPEIKSP